MEADDLLCSRNARSRTPLVGRAQWKINQPPSLKREQASWEVSFGKIRIARCVRYRAASPTSFAPSLNRSMGPEQCAQP